MEVISEGKSIRNHKERSGFMLTWYAKERVSERTHLKWKRVVVDDP
jgi:hypothetical protein